MRHCLSRDMKTLSMLFIVFFLLPFVSFSPYSSFPLTKLNEAYPRNLVVLKKKGTVLYDSLKEVENSPLEKSEGRVTLGEKLSRERRELEGQVCSNGCDARQVCDSHPF